MSVLPQLRERLKAQGAISVAEYMECCNSYYYATRDPLGQAGDFITAPEISQIFGELLGLWLAERWLQLGSPDAVLCEPGGGRGTLMRDFLRATRHVPQFHERISVIMVETSSVLRTRQQTALAGMHPRIHWQESLQGLPPKPLLLVANEFFDALPVQQFLEDGSERMIIWQQDALRWQQAGRVARETSPASHTVMGYIASHIAQHKGAAVMVDYGYEQRQVSVGKDCDTLQAMLGHRYAPVLEQPGEADLTAHVDFTALAEAARAQGVQDISITTQGAFLRGLGAELRAMALCKQAGAEQRISILSGLERLLSPQQMGELFKVLCIYNT